MDQIGKWLLRIILLVLGVIAIYQIIKKIVGGSWELEAIILALVIANFGYSFYIGNSLSEQRGWTSQFEKRFDALAADFKEPH